MLSPPGETRYRDLPDGDRLLQLYSGATSETIGLRLEEIVEDFFEYDRQLIHRLLLFRHQPFHFSIKLDLRFRSTGAEGQRQTSFKIENHHLVAFWEIVTTWIRIERLLQIL